MPTLDNLPPEVLHNILSFTSPFEWVSRIRKRPVPISEACAAGPALDAIAATNRYLHDVVEDYVRHLFKTKANLDEKSWRVKNYRQSGFLEDELDIKRSRLHSYRRKWFKYLSRHCITCQNSSSRRSIFEPGLIMCAKCDKMIPKMTMTEAKENHLLSALDLFTPNFLHPTLPPLTTGVYKCMGANATMISTPDVIARKAYIHSMITKAGKEVTEALLKRRCSSHRKLLGHLGFKYYSGGFYKYHFPSSEAESMKERRAIALAELDDMWKEMGVDPDKGMQLL